MKLEFTISGFYENGTEYFDNHYDIFELQEKLEAMQNIYELYHSRKGDKDKSEVISMETIHIETINDDGDYLGFEENKDKIKKYFLN